MIEKDSGKEIIRLILRRFQVSVFLPSTMPLNNGKATVNRE
jgi:hypothetical protein